MKFNKLLILLSAMLLLIIGACSNSDGKTFTSPNKDELKNLNETGFPIVKDKITLNFLAGKTPQTNDDWNDVFIYNEYKKSTNIDVKFKMVPAESLREKVNLMLGSGNKDLPDAFHTVGMSNSDLMKYGEQGVFVPLNDLIDKYAPNLKKLFKEYPEIKKAITMPDGSIYSFPTIEHPDFLSMRMAAKPYINKEWLNKLGMDMPHTTDAFYEYLKEVKKKDPGQNGGIPYGAPNINDLLSWLKGSFGISNAGFQNYYFDKDPKKEGNLRFYPISDGYKEMLQYVNKLFTQGLIEKNIFSIDTNQFLANAADGKYGSTNWYSPIDVFGKDVGGKFTGAPALKGPEGYKKYIGIRHPVVQKGVFTITSKNKYPASTVRWIDHFYGDEGAKLFFLGIEGKTFEEKKDGTLDFVDKIRNNTEGLTFEQEAAKYFTFPGGGAPALYKQDYVKGAKSSKQELDEANKLKPDLIKDPLPELSYKKDEMKDLDTFGADIEKYVTEMQDKFIAGDVSFDKWDEYINTIKKMGLQDYMKIQQAAYDRYQK